MTMKKYPEKIYITTDEDGYLLVTGQTVDELAVDDGDKVAVYKLVETATYRTHPRLEKVRKP